MLLFSFIIKFNVIQLLNNHVLFADDWILQIVNDFETKFDLRDNVKNVHGLIEWFSAALWLNSNDYCSKIGFNDTN